MTHAKVGGPFTEEWVSATSFLRNKKAGTPEASRPEGSAISRHAWRGVEGQQELRDPRAVRTHKDRQALHADVHQRFASGFLQTPGHPGRLAVQLALPLAGRAEDLHLQVSAPCRAHKEKSHQQVASHKARKLAETSLQLRQAGRTVNVLVHDLRRG